MVVVGNYVVDREIGRGGMGIVYAATHRVLGHRAAIKVLVADTIQHRDRVERFFNEARAATAIDHPGIIRVFDVGIDADGRAYIAMELLDGEALAKRLERGPMPVRVAIDVAVQIAEALAAAHRVGVIHRDLKPDNVICAAGGRTKLVDFGIAKLREAHGVRTATGAVIGTPAYMSPEQCASVRELDARSDLYSLGCVLFAMLCGGPPFTGETGALIGMHQHVAPPPLRTRCPAASAALEAIVARLLAKQPVDRFAGAREVIAALAGPEVSVLSPSGVAVTADPADARGSNAPAPAWGTGTSAPSSLGTAPTALTPALAPGPNPASVGVSATAPTVPTRSLPFGPPSGGSAFGPTLPGGSAFGPTLPGSVETGPLHRTDAQPSAPPAQVVPAAHTPAPIAESRSRAIWWVIGAAIIAAGMVSTALSIRACRTRSPATMPAAADAAVIDAARGAADAASAVDAAPVVDAAIDAAPERDAGVDARTKPPPDARVAADARVTPDAHVAVAPPPDAAVEPDAAVVVAPPVVAIDDRIVFGQDDSQWGADGDAVIAHVATVMAAHPTMRIQIVGFVSPSENPRGMGSTRANRVYVFLSTKVDRGRMQQARGQTPVAGCRGADGRCVEFVVTHQ